jgi:hypothetical protein
MFSQILSRLKCVDDVLSPVFLKTTDLLHAVFLEEGSWVIDSDGIRNLDRGIESVGDDGGGIMGV